jgi:hypothetical protein
MGFEGRERCHVEATQKFKSSKRLENSSNMSGTGAVASCERHECLVSASVGNWRVRPAFTTLRRMLVTPRSALSASTK